MLLVFLIFPIVKNTAIYKYLSAYYYFIQNIKGRDLKTTQFTLTMSAASSRFTANCSTHISKHIIHEENVWIPLMYFIQSHMRFVCYKRDNSILRTMEFIRMKKHTQTTLRYFSSYWSLTKYHDRLSDQKVKILRPGIMYYDIMGESWHKKMQLLVLVLCTNFKLTWFY